MKPYDFDYVRAESLEQVFELLRTHGDGARLLAGGQSLIASLNMRLSAPQLLIDITALKELTGVRIEAGAVRIGALTRHVEIQRSEAIRRHVPLLSLAIEHVAHAAIRNRGTIGGSIAFADPAAELPACAVALEADLHLLGPDGERRVAAGAFFRDLYTTALRPDEILHSIAFPCAPPGAVAAFREFARRRGDFALAGLAASGERDGAQLKRLNLSFFGVANTPVLALDTARLCVGRPLSPETLARARAALAKELSPIGDLYAGAAMKAHLAGHFLGQVFEELRAGS